MTKTAENPYRTYLSSPYEGVTPSWSVSQLVNANWKNSFTQYSLIVKLGYLELLSSQTQINCP